MKKLIFRPILVLMLSLCFNFRISAQIVCTDVNPDLVSSANSTVDIDMNNDAAPDFRLTSAMVSVPGNTLGFVIVQAGQIGVNNFVLTNGSGDALALPLNSVISSTSTTWTQMNGTNQQMITVINGAGSGSWMGAADLYLGLRFVVGANTYYGWARFTFSTNTNIYTFKDYAYNSVANQPILAGQGCSSLGSPSFSLSPQLCVGSTVTLTANTGTATASMYSWIVVAPGPVFSNSAAATTALTFPSAGVYTVGLVVSSGTTIGFAQNTVTVDPIPVVSISGNTTICSNQTLSLSANTASGSTFFWSGPNAFTSLAQNVVIVNPLPNVSGTYSVLVTGASGCTATAAANITVTPLPLSVINNNGPVCEGQNLNFTASGGTSYTWTGPGGFNSNSSSPTIPGVSVLASGVYSLALTLGPCIASSSVFVTVHPLPAFNVTSNSPVCETKTLSLSVSTVTNGVSYTWQGPGGFASTAQNVQLNAITLIQGGIYTVTVVDANACQTSSTTNVAILPNPVVTVTSATVCISQPTVLIASGADTYVWTGPGSFTSASTSVSLTGSGSAGVATYTITGTALNSCSAIAMASLNTQVCSGLSMMAENNRAFLVYPNPVKDKLFIHTNQAVNPMIRLTDVFGREILARDLYFDGTEPNTLDLHGISPGIYIVQVHTGAEGVQIIRIIKE